jgi:hypothetical protein
LKACSPTPPISLWEEDYSGVKQFFDELRSKNEAIEKTLMRADAAMYQGKLHHHANRK